MNVDPYILLTCNNSKSFKYLFIIKVNNCLIYLLPYDISFKFINKQYFINLFVYLFYLHTLYVAASIISFTKI